MKIHLLIQRKLRTLIVFLCVTLILIVVVLTTQSISPFIIINPEHPGKYYALFYFLAFVVGYVVLLLEGRRRNFPTLSWLLVISSTFLFFILGCRLITFSKEEWISVLHFEPIAYSTGASVIGGILFSIPAIFLAKKYLRFTHSMVDSFAMVLPVALIIERFGCLLSGCCYGTPSRFFWAIAYDQRSDAFINHVHHGLISNQAGYSLPVHPVQMYEVICCIGIILLLVQLRKKLRISGNLFLASFCLYGVVRFLLEFIRAHHGENQTLFGINTLQWGVLLIVPIVLLHIFRSERKKVRLPVSLQHANVGLARPGFLFVGMVFLLLVVCRWMRPLEIASLLIILVPFALLFVAQLFKQVTVPGFRIAALALPMAAMLLMNQTLPPRVQSDSTRHSYTTFNIGTMSGSTDLIFGEDSNDNCASSQTRYLHDFSAKAIGLSHTTITGFKKSTTLGLNSTIGKHEETVSGPNVTSSMNSFKTLIFSPYAQFDYPKFGIGIGFHAGNFTQIIPVTDGTSTSIQKTSFFPSLSLRVGDLDRVFAEYRLANQFPSSFPGMIHQFNLGLGFGKNNGGAFRLGTGTNTAVFCSAAIPLGGHLILGGFLGTGGGLFNRYDHTRSTIGSLNLQYKFAKK